MDDDGNVRPADHDAERRQRRPPVLCRRKFLHLHKQGKSLAMGLHHLVGGWSSWSVFARIKLQSEWTNRYRYIITAKHCHQMICYVWWTLIDFSHINRGWWGNYGSIFQCWDMSKFNFCKYGRFWPWAILWRRISDPVKYLSIRLIFSECDASERLKKWLQEQSTESWWLVIR